MITIGITGGVGAGKSTVLDFLEQEYQAYVMKADEIGHLVMEPGQSCYEPVIALFGKQVIKNICRNADADDHDISVCILKNIIRRIH